MDLERMLDKCRAGQWRVDDLDWSREPRPMSRADEEAIVQYFTDMAAIERLARALFEEHRRRVDHPILKKIFSTFVADEERHAVAAERLAAHYDVHQYRRYEVSEALVKFRPHFLNAVRHVPTELANIYITTGELMLDIALLRSIDDYVNDDMSSQAMRLINRDESRHIAVDYYMVEYYARPEYDREVLRDMLRAPLRAHAEAVWATVNLLYYAKPFLKSVFLEPIRRCDPSGRRIREAFRRIQMLARKPNVARRPYARVGRALQVLYMQPLLRRSIGGAISRAAGVPGVFLRDELSRDDLARVERMSMDELAREALQAKYGH